MKIKRNQFFEALFKNRYIFILCSMLILGTFFGTSMLRLLPQNMCENLFSFLSEESSNFRRTFFDVFTLPFITLSASFISGFSLIGSYFIPVIIFAEGAIYGFKNALFYSFSGSEHILYAAISFVIINLLYGFMLIIISESTIYLSKSYCKRNINIENETAEKPHYNAKNHVVKFITFTAVLMLTSVLFAYSEPIILSFVQTSF
ncbi:MAG: hypothetical protein IKL57_04555 [Oscillospiraceae bacterium]|nr:hypothetical protein [Oscillospiraceae bacterium]